MRCKLRFHVGLPECMRLCHPTLFGSVLKMIAYSVFYFCVVTAEQVCYPPEGPGLHPSNAGPESASQTGEHATKDGAVETTQSG
jgi:hypothetical protein